MANRIVGNIVIVDSAMGNSSILTPNPKLKAATVAFWSPDTTGNLILTGISTADHVVRLTNPNNNPTTVGIVMPDVYLEDIKVPTLTAGTAWIYLR